MHNSRDKPDPKVPSSRTPPVPQESAEERRDEGEMDEAVDESFPASDPPAMANPGSSLAVKRQRESGRKTEEPDTGKGRTDKK